MSEVETNTSYPNFKILSGSPADADLFGSKGHERTARALANSIEQLANRDGAIGLEGGWGAGKSSVVNFTKAELDNDSFNKRYYHIFTFDLWAHGAEDIRRAFLEELIGWADHQDRKLLTGKKSKKYYEEKIQDTHERIKITTKAKYSWWSFAFYLMLPVFPLALMWMSPFAIRNPGDAVYWQTLVALGAIVTIYFLALLRGVVERDPNAIINIFQKEQDKQNETINRFIRKKDPTTIEFHSIFRELLEQIQGSGNRVVAILDNIDRLPEDRIPELWGEVRSIFSARKPGSEIPSGASAITAIVPFSMDSISKAFHDQESTYFDVNELVRKTFDITVRVSPPISTDWQKFFYTKIEEAAAGIFDVDETYALFQILDTHIKTQLRYPTPREIINYINDITVLCSQWGTTAVPVTAIALFVLHKGKLLEKPQALLETGTIDERLLLFANLGSGWQRYIAALIYNVEPDKADQVYLAPLLTNLLNSGNASALKKYVEIDGFSNLITEIISSTANGWAEVSTVKFSSTALALQSIEIDGPQARLCWKKMGEAIQSLKAMEFDKATNLNGLEAILEHQENRSANGVVQRILSFFDRSLPPVEERQRQHGKIWASSVSRLLKIVDTISPEMRESIALKVPEGNSVNLGVAASCGSELEGDIEFEAFNLSADEDELASAFHRMIGEDPNDTLNIIRAKPAFLTPEHKIKAVEIISNRFRDEQLNGGTDRPSLIKALAELVAGLDKPLKEIADFVHFVKNGPAMWHAAEMSKHNDDEAMAAFLWVVGALQDGDLNLSNPNNINTLGEVAHRHNDYTKYLDHSEDVDQLIDCIYRYIARANAASRWLRISNIKNQSSVGALIQKRLVNEAKQIKFDSDELISSYIDISNVLEEKARKTLLSKVKVRAWTSEEETNAEYIDIIPIELLRDLDKWQLANWSELGGHLDRYFDSLAQQEWLSLLKSQGDNFDKYLLRAKHNNYSPPASNFRPAVQHLVFEVCRGEQNLTRDADAWEEMLESIPQQTRRKLIGDILSGLQNETPTAAGVSHLIGNFPSLAEAMIADTSKAKFIVNDFLYLLLSDESEDIKTFLKEHESQIKQVVKKAPEGSRLLLQEEIEGMERSDQEKGAHATWLRDLLGLEKPENSKS